MHNDSVREIAENANFSNFPTFKSPNLWPTKSTCPYPQNVPKAPKKRPTSSEPIAPSKAPNTSSSPSSSKTSNATKTVVPSLAKKKPKTSASSTPTKPNTTTPSSNAPWMNRGKLMREKTIKMTANPKK